MNDFKYLREQLEDLTEIKAALLAEILKSHGEVQIHMASGEVHSVHLGDSGILRNEYLAYKNRERGVAILFWGQVESLDYHKGYREG